MSRRTSSNARAEGSANSSLSVRSADEIWSTHWVMVLVTAPPFSDAHNLTPPPDTIRATTNACSTVKLWAADLQHLDLFKTADAQRASGH